MSRLTEIAKVPCGAEALHALVHAYFWFMAALATFSLAVKGRFLVWRRGRRGRGGATCRRFLVKEDRDMKKAMATCLALAVFAGLATITEAQTPAAAATKVTLTELHCMGCAKKISRKVTAVPGVAEMRVDLKAKTLFVIHKVGMTPSPRGLWDAIEQADHTPARMDTPSASYTAKPQS